MLVGTRQDGEAAPASSSRELQPLLEIFAVDVAGIASRHGGIVRERLRLLLSSDVSSPAPENSRVFRSERVRAPIVLDGCFGHRRAFVHARQAPPGEGIIRV